MKNRGIVLTLALIVSLTGCSNAKAETTPVDDNTLTQEEILVETQLTEETIEPEVLEPEVVEAEVTPIPVETVQYDPEIYTLNPLTGLYVENENKLDRPIAVMLDNQYRARPQAALSSADIVYEILAEGRITRYMAIFYGQTPGHVGPVRSSRPYFVRKALEFNPYYVHVGGSMQALADIKLYRMADIDGLASGAFWRESHKKIPHNMYTDDEALLKDGERRNYTAESQPRFLDFYESFTVPTGDDATEMRFVYKQPTQSDKVGYTTSYKYNNETQLYSRYTNNTPTIDEDTDEGLTCTNVLVQYAATKVIDSEGRLQIDLVGEGQGKLYTAGKVMSVTWQKADARATTYFYDTNGDPIKLNPGVTWIQVFEKGSHETIN